MTIPSFGPAFASAVEQFPQIPDLRFTLIDTAALDYRHRYWRQKRTKTRHSFDWAAIAARDMKRKSNIFGLALYSGQELFGLVLGKVVSTYGWIDLDRLEGAYQRDAVVKGMVIPCALAVVEDYACRNGFAAVRIIEPTPGAFDLYAAQPGYTLQTLNSAYRFFEKQMIAAVPPPQRDPRLFTPTAAPPAPP